MSVIVVFLFAICNMLFVIFKCNINLICMSNVMVTGLLCISMLLVASYCNPGLFIVKFYWNI